MRKKIVTETLPRPKFHLEGEYVMTRKRKKIIQNLMYYKFYYLQKFLYVTFNF